MQKWDYKTSAYGPYTPNPDWLVVMYSDDMDLRINCAAAGESMRYGEGYTSRTIHTVHGMGYTVCGDCYRKEVNDQREALRVVPKK